MTSKILVIKLGYSETLDPEIGRVPSLGDVLRTTPILWALKEKFPESLITWLVTENAEPLLVGNPLIDRLLVWDNFVPFQLMKEKFDVVVNLEKIPGVCALTDMIDAWVRYGFRLDTVNGTYQGYEKGLDFISYIAEKKTDKLKGYWQQVLVEMLGVPWREQPYIVGYRGKTREVYDVGFNKGMPVDHWEALELSLAEAGVDVSWQQGRNNLFEYIDWINSCKTLVSNDSLGMHLALAFGKKVIGLFGPTDHKEVFLYNNGKLILSSQDCPLRPCGANKCKTGLYCMRKIDLDAVTAAVLESLQREGGREGVATKGNIGDVALYQCPRHLEEHYAV